MSGRPGELLMIIGPPAVGKMTVGRAVAAQSDFRLFHNHHTIEPLLEIFGFDSEPFRVLNKEFRMRVVEEGARAGVRLIFSFVWNVREQSEADYVRELISPYADADLPISFAELYADLPTRLERNVHPDRLDHKRSKRDLDWSVAHVHDLEERFQMNTDPHDPTIADALMSEHRHLRLDNTDLTPEESAARILTWLEAR